MRRSRKPFGARKLRRLARRIGTLAIACLRMVPITDARYAKFTRKCAAAALIAGAILGGQQALHAQGGPVTVNATVTGQQSDSAIAMDDDGDYVVVWVSDHLGYGDDIFAQRFDSSGVAQGGEIHVNSSNYYAYQGDQNQPDVAMDSDGDFVVVWDNNKVAYGRRFDAYGNPQGSEFYAAYSPDSYTEPAIAMDDNGNFAVSATYESQYYGNYGITVHLFNNNGVSQGTPTATFQGSSTVDHSDIAMDADGDFVVVWEQDDQNGRGIYAQLFDEYGTQVGFNFQVNSTNSFNQEDPSVAMDSDGNFTVAFESPYYYMGSFYYDYVHVRCFDYTGYAANPDFRVSVSNGSEDNSMTPRIAMTANGESLVSWVSRDSAYGFIEMVELDSNGTPTTLPIQVFSDMLPVSNGGVALDQSGDNLVLTWQAESVQGASYFDDIFAQRFTDGGLGVPTVIGNDTFWDQREASIAMDADGDFVIVWTSDHLSYGDDDIFAQRFNKNGSAVGPEIQVNSPAATSQCMPDVAMDADGNFVIVWDSGPGHAVFAKRFDANGNALSGEFFVGDSPYGATEPAIAMDDDGDFVISWSRFDYDVQSANSYFSIEAQTFNSFGTPQTSITVDSAVNDLLNRPDVAMDADGDFVVTWEGDSYGVRGIFAGVFDSSGSSYNGNFQVNAGNGYDNENPVVAMDAEGDFTVAWEAERYYGTGSSGGVYGAVYANRFDYYGNSLTGDFLISSGYDAYVYDFNPEITATKDGGAVVTWQVDQGGTFAIESATLGNSDTSLNVFVPDIITTDNDLITNCGLAMDADGDNIVTAWQTNNLDDDSYFGEDVFAQAFTGIDLDEGNCACCGPFDNPDLQTKSNDVNIAGTSAHSGKNVIQTPIIDLGDTMDGVTNGGKGSALSLYHRSDKSGWDTNLESGFLGESMSDTFDMSITQVNKNVAYVTTPDMRRLHRRAI